MKIVIFKGEAPFNLRGDWGCITIEGRGVINRVDEVSWSRAKKAYSSFIEDFITRGYLIDGDTKDSETFRDDEVDKDALSDAESKQGSQRSPSLGDDDTNQKKDKSQERVNLEKKSAELGIPFDDKTSSAELKRKIREKLGRA